MVQLSIWGNLKLLLPQLTYQVYPGYKILCQEWQYKGLLQ